MNNFSLSIIIPILNEVQLIPSRLEALEKNIETSSIDKEKINVIICDGGSTDGSRDTLSILQKKYNFMLIQKDLEYPSVGKTLNLAKNSPLAKYCLFLPIDCHLSSDCLKSLQSKLHEREYVSGGFLKSYEKSNFFYDLYSFLQNFIRSTLMRNLVWTNAIWLDSQLFHEGIISEEGFLEDVLLSDTLKKYPNLILKEKILVSPRKYKQRFLRRLWVNLNIMVSFRLKLKTINELKKIYQE